MTEVRKNIVSLDDDGVVKQSNPVFKGQQDHYYRIHFPEPENIFMFNQHFDDDAKFLHCLQDKGETCPACEKVGPPIQKFKANIVVYNTTTEDGTLPEDLNFVSLSPQIIKFGSKMWNAFKTKHKKFAKQGGLKSIDLILKCTNGQFQHFEVEDDTTCAVRENDRLKAMFEKAKSKFADFHDPNDFDNRFPTPTQVKTWVEKASGIKINVGDDEPEVDANSGDSLLGEDVAPQANIGDII